jgi:hypothetical protein
MALVLRVGNGNGYGNGNGNGTGGGDRSPDTLAATGPSVNAPLLAVSLAAIAAGVGLIATSLRIHRRRP